LPGTTCGDFHLEKRLNVVNETAKTTPKSDCHIRCADRKKEDGQPPVSAVKSGQQTVSADKSGQPAVSADKVAGKKHGGTYGEKL